MKTTDPVHELFLNYACNAKCAFCYNPPITPELLRRELSFAEAAESLYAGAKAGAKRLNLHGGEVTLRDDLPKILRLARKVGFEQVTVVTNGVRLGSAPYARSLVAAGATHVRLSIHGADAAGHDPVLAVPGAFDRAVAALGILRQLAVPVGLNFVLHRANFRSLPAFLRRFCLKDEVRDVIVYFPHLRGMMGLNAAQAGVSYREIAPFVRNGFEILREADRMESLWLANFPPCVLPEYAGRMLDWTRDSGGGNQAHPEGFSEDIHAMKDGQRRPIRACLGCALERRCLGVEGEYLDLRGAAEFKTLRAPPEGAA